MSAEQEDWVDGSTVFTNSVTGTGPYHQEIGQGDSTNSKSTSIHSIQDTEINGSSEVLGHPLPDTRISTSTDKNASVSSTGGQNDILHHNHIVDDNKRYCWVCFATDEDDLTAQWVKPCRCRGTTKWVHQACIQRWIDEKQKGITTAKVSCPQCNTDYYIMYPRQGPLVIIMDSLDALISKVCPFVAAGLVVGSIYWTAVTYGAVTVMQVAGHKEGLSLMEQADPLILLVGLPTIPVMLILSKMVRWEDQVLRFIRKHSSKIPLLRHILPALKAPSVVEQGVSQDLPPLSDPVSATRILCGALLFPTISTILGKILFENVKSNFQRAILGGVAFITIKGVLRLYHKQQKYARAFERKILDFNEDGDDGISGTGSNYS